MRIFNLFPITPRDLTCIPVAKRSRGGRFHRKKGKVG